MNQLSLNKRKYIESDMDVSCSLPSFKKSCDKRREFERQRDISSLEFSYKIVKKSEAEEIVYIPGLNPKTKFRSVAVNRIDEEIGLLSKEISKLKERIEILKSSIRLGVKEEYLTFKKSCDKRNDTLLTIRREYKLEYPTYIS